MLQLNFSLCGKYWATLLLPQDFSPYHNLPQELLAVNHMSVTLLSQLKCQANAFNHTFVDTWARRIRLMAM